MTILQGEDILQWNGVAFVCVVGRGWISSYKERIYYNGTALHLLV